MAKIFSKIGRLFRKTKCSEPGAMDPESALQQLKNYDTQFLIDDSKSMGGSRWTEARDALVGLTKKALQYDVDGVEVYFLNDEVAGGTIKSPDGVAQLFDTIQLGGLTPTGNRIENILAAYTDRLNDARASGQLAGMKPLNLIVITDGEPTDDPESVIIAAARRLEAERFPETQVGIQFIQIGDDKKARKSLEKLDNDLTKHGVWDIVDTKPHARGKKLTSERLMMMLLGGIDKRVDRMREQGA